MADKKTDGLKPYRIPLLNHGPYFGVFMASHSIPDSILVMHKGTGCKMKGSTHITDLFHESFSQICWTEVSGVDILTDSHAMIEDTVLTSYERRRPGVIAVATSSVIELTGFDIRESVEKLQPRLKCPLIYVPTSGYEGDMYDGLADFAMELAGHVDWSLEPEQGVVNIFGYPFERYEMDHGANIRELMRMLRGMGLKPGAWYFSGQRAADLLAAHRGQVNVVLPYFGKHADELAKLSGRPTIRLDMPMGVKGTAMWLEKVAEAAGADPEKSSAFINAESKRVNMLLDIFRRYAGENRMCIMQPTPVAAALTAFVTELGLKIFNVGLLDNSLGGGKEFKAALKRLAGDDAPDVNILENPSMKEVNDLPEFNPDKTSRKHSVIISPTIELDRNMREELLIVEVGSPSYYRHAIYPSPTIGFDGAVSLAQRIMDVFSFTH